MQSLLKVLVVFLVEMRVGALEGLDNEDLPGICEALYQGRAGISEH